MQHAQHGNYAVQPGSGSGSRRDSNNIKQTSNSPTYLGQGVVPDAESDEASEDDYDQTAATTGGKRKRPVSVSCELCKQRKVSHDRLKQSTHFTPLGLTSGCEYKERKKPGLRAGYGRELEGRLDKLEVMLRSHAEILTAIAPSYFNNSPAVSGGTADPRSRAGQSQDAAPAVQPTQSSTLSPRAGAALLLQGSSDYASATQPMQFGQQQQGIQGNYSNQLPISDFSPVTDLQTGQNSTPQEYYGSAQAGSMAMPVSAPIAADQDMPPYDLLYALVDLFFKHINTWCPILHRKTTLDTLFGPSTLRETDRILLHAIVATTMRYSKDPRLTEERRQHYHQVSKQRVLLYGMENSSVQSLQALVILALDLCGSSNGPPGWNIMALITRSVVQLGLAVETTSSLVSPNFTSIYTLRAMVLPEPRDFIEEESRRRLFWMVYLLDRYATISTAFDFALDDKEIDRMLPCRDDLWMRNQKVETRWFRPDSPQEHTDEEQHADKPENMGAFSWYIEVLGILSNIHKFLKQPVDISALSDVERWQLSYKELDQCLATWNFSLPPDLRMDKLYQTGHKSLSCGWVMLQAAYHTAVIRLHSSAAYPTTRSPIFTPSYSASQRCLGAVESIVALGEFVGKQGLLSKLGPPFAFTLWVAARLLLVHGSTIDHKLSPHVSFFVESLREMGRYWPVAARYCELLQRVLDEHNDSERQGDGVTPSSVKILADMRRTAFDLDFLISRQPRNNNGAGGGPAMSRLPSVTPARTPQPNDLEYLDVFDFFNVPRLPFGGDNLAVSGPAAAAAANGGQQQTPGQGGMGMDAAGAATATATGTATTTQLGQPSEYNITNFMVDASSDWLFKTDDAKFMPAG
ncbi:fungal specific transcription factor domain-containing protein [Sarocladium implicatum]|nr:fungal specific transcription factor domain-containing protein [Sarocladium implicatum]